MQGAVCQGLFDDSDRDRYVPCPKCKRVHLLPINGQITCACGYEFEIIDLPHDELRGGDDAHLNHHIPAPPPRQILPIQNALRQTSTPQPLPQKDNGHSRDGLKHGAKAMPPLTSRTLNKFRQHPIVASIKTGLLLGLVVAGVVGLILGLARALDNWYTPHLSTHSNSQAATKEPAIPSQSPPVSTVTDNSRPANDGPSVSHRSKRLARGRHEVGPDDAWMLIRSFAQKAFERESHAVLTDLSFPVGQVRKIGDAPESWRGDGEFRYGDLAQHYHCVVSVDPNYDTQMWKCDQMLIDGQPIEGHLPSLRLSPASFRRVPRQPDLTTASTARPTSVEVTSHPTVEFNERLAAVPRALRLREFEKARMCLDRTRSAAVDPQQADALRRWTILYNCVVCFWNSVDQAVRRLPDNTDLPIDEELGQWAHFVIANEREIKILHGGQPHRYTTKQLRDELHPLFAMALFQAYRESSPASDVLKAAFLLAEPKAAPTGNGRDRARTLLEKAMKSRDPRARRTAQSLLTIIKCAKEANP